MISSTEATRYLDVARNPNLPADTRRKAERLCKLFVAHADLYDTKRSDVPEVKSRLSELSAEADRLHAELSRPAYLDDEGTRHSVGIDDGVIAVPKSAVTYLTKSDRMVDYLKSQGHRVHSIEYRYGRLGAGIKAAMGYPDDLARYAKYDAPEAKDMTLTGSSVLVPAVTSAQLIDEMRARTVVVQLGARTVPMDTHTTKIPRIVGGPSASWLAEGSAIPTTDATVDSVDLVAKRLAALTRASQEVTEDSDPVDLGAVLSQSLSRDFATELDRVALRGSGIDPEPDGVRNSTGVTVTSLGANGGPADWNDLVTANATLATSNAQCSGFAFSPRTLSAIESERETSGAGQFVTAPSIIGDLPRLATTQIPTNITAGTATATSEIYAADWSQLLIGSRVQFELRVLAERYADFGQVGFAARLRAGIALEHGDAFVVVADVTN